MATITRPDGIDLHFSELGSGPLVVIVVHWSGHPTVFEALVADLSVDHRVVTYDSRGTGLSTRAGPHDMRTGAADLTALIEEVGGPAVIVTLGEGCNRAVRTAALHPSLVTAIVAPGTVPLGRKALAGADALVASEPVIEGFITMLDRQYRGAQRTLMTTSNPQLSEAEIRDRVDLQVAYCPRETAIARVNAWLDDDPVQAAREIGDKLWILSAPDMAGPWFPAGEKLDALIATLLPDAHVEHVADGVVSRPDLTAAIVRRVTSR